MNYYNKKCKGCGGYFSSDKNSPSYIEKFDDNKKYCLRCFQLINYGKNTKIVNDDSVNEVLKKIYVKDSKILMVIDLLDIAGSLIEEYKESNNIYFAINKLSFMPKNFNKERSFNAIARIIKDEGFVNFKNIFFYDSKSNIGIKNIYNNLFKNKKNTKVYIVGRTNVGKSSLINSLLKLCKENNNVTVSPYKNTTLNFNKIKIENNFIIDTPGYPVKNFTLFMDDDILKKTFNSVPVIHTISFKKNNSKQAVLCSNFFTIDIEENMENASLTIYTYKNIKIHRTKIENKDNILLNSPILEPRIEIKENLIRNEFKIEQDKNCTFISGLGIVVFKKIKKIAIYCPKEINVDIYKESII